MLAPRWLVLGPFWDPLGAKVALDAIWSSIWAALGPHLGAKMEQDGAKIKLGWPTWRLRNHLGSILGSILDHF